MELGLHASSPAIFIRIPCKKINRPDTEMSEGTSVSKCGLP